ncbi:MAG: ABC transporter permease [Myxococcaceae bacterium]
MLLSLETLLHATLDYAPAVVFAAMGGVVSERAGVIALGLEGMMRVGAFAAAVAALVMPTPLAVCVGALMGVAFSSIHGALAVTLRADGAVSGLALNLIALAAGTYLLEAYFLPQGTPSIAQLSRWTLPGLAATPVLRALSRHTGLTYAAALLPALLAFFLHRTVLGLRLRAVGESTHAASSAGLSVTGLRWGAVLLSGALAGLGGATLSTTTLDRFEPHMPSGLGFVALASVVFGRWSPWGAAGAAVLFAAASALRVTLGNAAPHLFTWIPGGVLLALPYVLTLLLLATRSRGTGVPAALGRP